MRVLIACEFSGAVRRAFEALGHDVISCDLLPSDDNSPYHYQGDVRDLLGQQWDLIIAFPPCTYLSCSGLHWNKRGRMVNGRPRAEETEDALKFVRLFLGADCKALCIENPQGCICTRIPEAPKPQYVQPYEYGHDASKKTGLHLRNLPRLIPTKHIAPRIVNGKNRWANQTDSGQNKLAPSPTRERERGRTYQGIADAMAKQWTAALAKVAP